MWLHILLPEYDRIYHDAIAFCGASFSMRIFLAVWRVFLNACRREMEKTLLT